MRAPAPLSSRLLAAIASYLEEIRATKKPKTLAAYALSLEYFAQSCQKPYVSDVERSDLLAYSGHLRDTEELAPRTVPLTADPGAKFCPRSACNVPSAHGGRPQWEPS
jgi:hypothetical protein